MRRLVVAAVVAAVSAALVVLPAPTASAHEVRAVGAYRFTVGFGEEPAYLGQENFVQFFLATRAGKPVTDLGNGLELDVEVGNQAKALALDPSFDPDTGLGTPGEYDAFFFPTALGKYTFHFHGSIHGQKVNESFTSGPTSFSEVESPTPVQFPTRVPTTADIAALLNRALPRASGRVAEVRSDLQSEIDSARLVGVVGIVVGALGLIAGGVALARRRRT